MKHFTLFLAVLLFLSFTACNGANAVPMASATEAPTIAPTEIPESYKPPKDGYDETTNTIYTFGSYTVSIPDYYYETEKSDTTVKLVTMRTKFDAGLFLGGSNLDMTLEEYEAERDDFTNSIINSFTNFQINSDEAVTISQLTGRKVMGIGEDINGISLSFILFHGFDPNNSFFCFILFLQADTSAFDYTSDAEKTIQSITFDISAEVTKQPTAKPTKQPTKKPTAKPTATPKKEVITYDAFCKIKMGMNLDEVKQILGNDASLVSSSEIYNVKSEIYSWKGSSFSSITITFSNGQVIGRSQSGLNQKTATVSAAKFSQITSGMTYEQVKEIMGGDGYISSESSIMGIVTTIYQWDGNNAFSMAMISFQNGKVTSMSQYGLS